MVAGMVAGAWGNGHITCAVDRHRKVNAGAHPACFLLFYFSLGPSPWILTLTSRIGLPSIVSHLCKCRHRLIIQKRVSWGIPHLLRLTMKVNHDNGDIHETSSCCSQQPYRVSTPQAEAEVWTHQARAASGNCLAPSRAPCIWIQERKYIGF